MAKLQSFDFSEPKLKAIAPPMPKIKATWAEMLAAWERSTGGTLEIDGYGVSATRKSRYDVAIREIQQVLPAFRQMIWISQQHVEISSRCWTSALLQSAQLSNIC